jgi:hypothetical protein
MAAAGDSDHGEAHRLPNDGVDADRRHARDSDGAGAQCGAGEALARLQNE